jgi:uncharacterized protein YebE (UPF0316 family)
MNISQFIDSNLFNFVILPILIFSLRVIDVSMGTIRIIFISRDIRVLPAIIGFFEVLIWLFAIGQIMRNLNSPLHYVAFAAGFGMGTFVGVTIERKFSYGSRIIQVITSKDAAELITALKRAGYNITSTEGKGAMGPVKLIFTVVKRSKVDEIIKLIRHFNPKAFYTIEDVRFVQDKYAYPGTDSARELRAVGSIFQKRK